MTNPFDQLLLIGLLIREALLLGFIRQTYTLSRILDVTIPRVLSERNFASSERQKEYDAFRREFFAVVTAYVHRGHIETSQESQLYPEGSYQAINGYILNQASGFITCNEDRVFNEWQTILAEDGRAIDALIQVGVNSQWEMISDDYLSAAFEEYKRGDYAWTPETD